MSGGSYDYFCYKLENDFIDIFKNNLGNDPVRKAFLKHLELVAKALYEIEWADSGDTLRGERDKDAMLKCINKQDVLAQLVEEASVLKGQLDEYTND